MDIDDDEAFLYGDSPPSSSAQVELPTISKQAGDGEVSNVDGPIGGEWKLEDIQAGRKMLRFTCYIATHPTRSLNWCSETEGTHCL